MGLEGETDCVGGSMAVDWSGGGEFFPPFSTFFSGKDGPEQKEGEKLTFFLQYYIKKTGSHPATYWHHDISGDLIERQRASDDSCEPSAALDAARPLFLRLEQLSAGAAARGCAWSRARAPAPPGVPEVPPVLTPRCTLFARKFVREVSERLLGLVEGDDGLRLLDPAQPTCKR